MVNFLLFFLDRVKKLVDFKELIYKKGLNNKYINKKTGEEIKLGDPDDLRQEWGLEINSNGLDVNARFLGDPEIKVGEGSKICI